MLKRHLCPFNSIGNWGETVGCGAHLKALRRVSACGFSVEQAVGLEALKLMSSEEAAARVLPLS